MTGQKEATFLGYGNRWDPSLMFRARMSKCRMLGSFDIQNSAFNIRHLLRIHPLPYGVRIPGLTRIAFHSHAEMNQWKRAQLLKLAGLPPEQWQIKLR